MKVLKRYEENGKELVLAITPEGKKSIPYPLQPSRSKRYSNYVSIIYIVSFFLGGKKMSCLFGIFL